MKGPVTILIVDDDAGVRSLIERNLSGLGAVFRHARNLSEGMEKMAQEPNPNFVFLDIGFPDSTPEDTFELAKKLRDINPGCVIVAITGRSDETLPQMAAQVGINLFKQKLEIASQESLFAAVKECLAKSVKEQPIYRRNQEMLKTLTRLMTPTP